MLPFDVIYIQRSKLKTKGVDKFTEWEYILILTGKDDWYRCTPGCQMHDYPPGAAPALVLLGYIKNETDIAGAKAKRHWVCRLLISTHSNKGVGIYQSVSHSNIGQHMLRKDAPAVVQLFMYVNEIK